MKLKFIFILSLISLGLLAYGQQNICSDSSFRMRYIFGNEGASLFINPDSSGINTFTGYFSEGPNEGIALLKTNWGDSMFWARKIYLNGKSLNSFLAPDGSIITSGYFGTGSTLELLVARFDSNGRVLWIKRFQFQNHLRYIAANAEKKNILVTNNAIYLNGVFLSTDPPPNNGFNVILKLDLNGNIIWSKSFRMNSPAGAGVVNAPVLHNNQVIFSANYSQQIGPTLGNFLTVLTKLNDLDGSISGSEAIKITTTDTLGSSNTQLNINPDSSFSLTGHLIIKYPIGIGFSNIIFNTQLDKDFTPAHIFFYTNNVPLIPSDFYFDFNNQKQHSVLATDAANFRNKYFAVFDNNDQVLRTRKFIIPSALSTINQTSVNIDDDENIHFLFHYPQSGKLITEYARISNFSPDGTLGCFGKDTSIFTRYPLTMSKELFTWDNVQTNIILSNNVPYTEDTAIVTKELVCKIVSRCDSVHINGPASACIGQPVRYTVSKNSGCFKNLDWAIDTSFADIVNAEGDSAINISFKKAFTGYIHAALTDCVVKDSFFVKAVAPVPRPLINRTDSLLCPGKILTLAANSGFTNYLWQNSTTGQQLVVNAAGMYKVTALDSCNNLKTDSINITLSDTSLNLIPTQTICLFDTAFIVLPAGVVNITWQPTSNSLLRNNTLVAYPSQSTVYNITAERQANCPIGKNSEVIIKTCPQTVFIPNSFTPNNDGRNDIFKPAISQALALYHFTIYNRYGQTVFETTSQSAGWDGKYKGALQPQGGYTYHCRYRFNGLAEKNVKGYFLLIR